MPTEMQAVVTMRRVDPGSPGLESLNCHSQPSLLGHLETLTTRDTLADAVDICAKLGRVLQTVHLSGLLRSTCDAGSSSCGRKDRNESVG